MDVRSRRLHEAWLESLPWTTRVPAGAHPLDGFVSHMRLVSLLFITAFCVTACATAHARATLSAECASPNSSIDLAGRSTDDRGRSVAGQVESLDGQPISGAIVELYGKSAYATHTDTTGHFRLESIPEGRYQLRALHMGHDGATDSITVPMRRTFKIQLSAARDVVSCANEGILAERPILVPAQTDSTVIEREIPGGARVRHVVVATPTSDGVYLRSRIVNLGPAVARLTQLCRPRAAAPVLRELISPGPTCYGYGADLAVGDSLVVVTGGPLRGRGGRYEFHVHAVDPAVLDVTLPLAVVTAPD
jgi:carboxypeptidase family protein